MSFYDLQARFWQLDIIERFTGTETRLYFYWLNRFNAEFWPAELSRWGTQVLADLGLTDKTLAAARTVLTKRGLLGYKEGSKSRAAVWSLPELPANMNRNNSDLSSMTTPDIDRNNSESSAIDRNNSDESETTPPNMSRNNSESSGAIPPNMSRNNSGLYKEKTNTSSRVEDKDISLSSAAVAASASGAEKKIKGVQISSTDTDSADASASYTGPASRVGTRKSAPKAPAPLLLRDSHLADFAAFADAWQAAAEAHPETYADYSDANLRHYHTALLDWSDANGKKKLDWLATIRSSIRNDYGNGRLRTYSAQGPASLSAPGFGPAASTGWQQPGQKPTQAGTDMAGALAQRRWQQRNGAKPTEGAMDFARALAEDDWDQAHP